MVNLFHSSTPHFALATLMFNFIHCSLCTNYTSVGFLPLTHSHICKPSIWTGAKKKPNLKTVKILIRSSKHMKSERGKMNSLTRSKLIKRRISSRRKKILATERYERRKSQWKFRRVRRACNCKHIKREPSFYFFSLMLLLPLLSSVRKEHQVRHGITVIIIVLNYWVVVAIINSYRRSGR